MIVIEPQINITKTVEVGGVPGNTGGDAGDAVEYVITKSQQIATRPTAYEAVLSDFLSTDIDFTSGGYGITNVVDSALILGVGDFRSHLVMN